MQMLAYRITHLSVVLLKAKESVKSLMVAEE